MQLFKTCARSVLNECFDLLCSLLAAEFIYWSKKQNPVSFHFRIAELEFICVLGIVAERIAHIQSCGYDFVSQWQWMRLVIVSESVFRSFQITPRWFPQRTPVSSTYKKVVEAEFEIKNIMLTLIFHTSSVTT